MDQNTHIAGRNVNAGVFITVLRENVLQRPNNAVEFGITVICQFSVLENHYGAISTITTVLRDYELLLVTQEMEEHTQRRYGSTRWNRGKRDEGTGEHSCYIASLRKGLPVGCR
jgi:hypothetical protein